MTDQNGGHERRETIRKKIGLLVSMSPGFVDEDEKGKELSLKDTLARKYFNLLPKHHRKDSTTICADPATGETEIRRKRLVSKAAYDLWEAYGGKLVEEWDAAGTFRRSPLTTRPGDDLGLHDLMFKKGEDHG